MKSTRLMILLMLALLSACGNPGVEISAGPTPGAAATATLSPTQQRAAATPTLNVATATFVPTPTSPPTATSQAATPTAAATATSTVMPATPTAESTATAQPTVAPTTTPMPAGATVAPTTTGSPPTGAAIRPDLNGVLAFVRDGAIYAYQPQTGGVSKIIDNGRDMQFSRDGAQIAFVRHDGLYLAAADGSNQQRIVEQAGIVGPQWSDDGSKIAFERVVDRNRPGSGEIWTIELPGGTAHKIANGADPAWAPDGKRLAYVTEATGEPRRGQLRLTNWLGQNDWAVIKTVPENTPPLGVPGHEFTRDQLDHLLFAPAWDAAGGSIYVPSFVGYQALTDFGIWERANAYRGTSTFVSELRGATDGFAAPNRQAVVFTVGSARGDMTLLARALDPSADGQYAWATYTELANSSAPAWSPDSAALAFFRCDFDDPNRCDLVVTQPGQPAPAVLIADVFGTSGPDRESGLFLAWGR